MKKSYSLKIVSIVTMLSAVVRFVMGVMMFNFFSKSSNVMDVPQIIMTCSIIAFVLILIFVLALTICGFVGAICWDDPEIAPKCVILGVITLVLGLAGDWFQAYAGYPISYLVWITSAAVPALYIVVSLIFHISFKASRKKKTAQQ